MLLENLYAVFRIPPFGPPKVKAVKKEQKLYFWDWSRVENEAARFENMIAMHLLRFCHWKNDYFGEKCELRYFRNIVGHEVDFIVLRKGKPWFAVEAKMQDTNLDSNLKYLLERCKIPFAFQVNYDGTNFSTIPKINDCKIFKINAQRFLAAFP